MTKRAPEALVLRAAAERAALVEVSAEDLAALPAPAPGRWAHFEGADPVHPPELMTRLAGRVGGPAPRPSWADGSEGTHRRDTIVCRVADVRHLPRFGAVIGAEGQVYASTVGEALSLNPDLAAMPYVTRDGEARLFTPPSDAPRIEAATVFMAKGGEFNYGHFLLDCLPALLASESVGLTRALPPLAPPLKRWNRELLALAFPDLAVREVREEVVRLGDAAFATAMDHYLHHPHDLVPRLRDRILANAPRSGTGPRRVYISRRAYPMRVMVDEPALEAALAARGFTIARTERLSVAEQIALVRDAQVVVGPTGAGLANALFAPEGAKVVEIQPEIFTSWWLRNLVHLCGGDWHGYFCPAPTAVREAPWRYRIRRGFRWAYRLGVDEFVRFLDERL